VDGVGAVSFSDFAIHRKLVAGLQSAPPLKRLACKPSGRQEQPMEMLSLHCNRSTAQSEFEALKRLLSCLKACNSQTRHAVDAGVRLADNDFTRRFAAVEALRRSGAAEQESLWADLGELELGLRSQDSAGAMGVSLYRIWLTDTLRGRRRRAELLVQELTELRRRVHRRFAARPGGKLVIEVAEGGIEVTGTKEDTVAVDLFRDVRGLDLQTRSDQETEPERSTANVAIQHDGSTVRILAGQDRDPELARCGNGKMDLHLVVSVPDNFNLDLTTGCGGITVAELNGTVKSTTSAGALSFTNVRGDIDGCTAGGGIQLKGCEGAACIETGGGTIDIRDHKGDVMARSGGGGIHCERVEGKLDAETSGGAIGAVLDAQPTRDCRLATEGGGIAVTLPGSCRLDIEAQTGAGSVDLDLPVVGNRERTSLQGKLNGGGPLLRLCTGAGSVDIRAL
jgi:hypothetical protein